MLGGQEEATRLVGGIRWWQVRGLQGIDANWVAEKRDIEAIKRARKEPNRSPSAESPMNGESVNGSKGKTDQKDEDSSYPSEMDEMPCMLYLHGGKYSLRSCAFTLSYSHPFGVLGGYFFGSVDQERYCMQRYARWVPVLDEIPSFEFQSFPLEK